MIIILVISMFTPVSSNKVQAAEVISVADAISNNSGDATIEGYIIGTANSGTSYDQEAPFSSHTNLGLADDPTETDSEKIIPVQLPSGDIRTDLNLRDNPDNFQRKVQLTGSLEAYFSVPGLKSTSAYVFVEESAPVAKDLLISEYIEGGSFNKAIELFNGTGETVDLSSYSLELYSNGASEASQTLELSGSLEDGKTFVLYHNDAMEEIKNNGDLENSTVINFNGDDPVVLRNSGNVIDSIGQTGERIGNMKDVTLVRNGDIISGDTVIDDAFDPSTEWTSLPKDDASNLGIHEFGGVKPGEPDPEPEPEEPAEPISIADARAQETGEVTVQGTVTAKLKNTIHIQDETAAIAVRPTTLNVQLGDEITVTGALDEYNGLLQIQNAALVGEVNQVGVPNPAVLTGDQLNEENESKLATVHNVTLESVQEGNGWANFTATDGTEFLVRDETATLDLSVGKTYDAITGIVQQFNDDYQIIPRSTADVIADESAVQAVTATPAGGTIASGSEVALSTTTDGATIYYTTNGDEPTADSEVYQEPIVVDQAMTIKAIAVKEGMDSSAVTEFAYDVFDQEAGIQIHDIQGESHESALNNTFVTDIQGVVTYTYKLGSGNYFHFQTPDELADENPNTSEGIVVYTGNRAADVQIGDLVNVTGTIDEYHIDGYYDTKADTDLPVTQINARDDRGGVVSIVESGVELPTPIQIDESNLPAEVIDNDGFAEFDPEEDAIDFWESLEGMLVEVGTVKAVSPQEHGDLITVLEGKETNTLHGGVKLTEETANPDRIQFKLYDNNAARDFEVATGDTFEGPITGVVNYGFQNYKIYADLEDMEEKHVEGNATPETTTIVKNEDELTIASYNLENFSNNRSSSSEDKAIKLARAFAKDMQSPDIIGVTEVQDNNGQDSGDSAANESYERLIQAIVDAGGVEYEYANIDPVNNADGGAPNSNIRVGFLYNPDRVTLTEGMPAGDATTAVGYENGKLTHNPGRIDPTNRAFDDSRKPLAAQFDFQGESVVVLVNHWNSKSGDTPLFGSTQPPVYGSEEQRKEIAKVVNGFVEDIKADNPEANIVSVGDFNDFQFTDALKIHEGEHMTNMINHVEDNDRYTYLYQGNSQVLDHILVSNNLVENTEIDILHINADFTDMAGRASDHDPVMVQVDLNGQEEAPEQPEEIVPEKVYNFTDYKTGKLVINQPSVSITLNGDSQIKNGVDFRGNYAEFHGDGFENTTVTINPKSGEAIIDFTGIDVEKVIINDKFKGNVKEIRGAENIETIEYGKGVDQEDITITNSDGKPLGSPSVSLPETIKSIPNQTVEEGGTITLSLNDYFQDPNGKALSYETTFGEINSENAELTLTLEEGSYVVAVTASNEAGEVKESFSVTVNEAAKEEDDEVEVPAPVDDYYSDAYGKEGTALKTALHEIIDDHHQLSYSEVWDALKITDEDPNNQNNVMLLYSGESRAKNKNGGMVGDWNREHTWAKSHGDFGTSKGPGTDIHHLRPTDVQVNSSRGNLDFDFGGSANVKNCVECKRDGDSFEAPDEVKGDVARMLFYMAVRYEQGDRVDLELNEQVNNGKTPYHGKLSILLEWHEQDPVSEWEQNRNDKIEDIQGNRNPFIDNPEWADDIWGAGA